MIGPCPCCAADSIRRALKAAPTGRRWSSWSRTSASARRGSAQTGPVATRPRSSGTDHGASSRSESESTASSIPARPSSSSARSRPTASTADGHDAPSAGIVTGVGPDRGRDLRDRRQRRHGQGRHVLPAHGQEAPARPGDRPREPPAVRLPRRLGRRLPAAPGRRLPGSRALRPDLLQPGPPVGRGDPPGRPGDGQQHGRWRVRPGDERRDRDREGHRHDLPRRSAPGEGRHRRGRQRRGPRRGERPCPDQRGGRPRGARRRARARARALDRGEPEPDAARAALGAAPARGRRRCPPTAAGTPPTSTARSRPTCAGRWPSAR